MTRYKCLVLDHDDTAVMSTAAVHYPSFVETLQALRPGGTMTLSEYNRLCFDPGFERMCYDLLHFTQDEMAWQLTHWQRYVEAHVPPFHPGMPEVIRRQKAEGGLVCVISQSYSRFVRRDYEAAGLPPPDRTLGWELGPDMQKPHPAPLRTLMAEYSLSPSDVLVVDDLKPGFDMARAVGCACAAALWGHADDPAMLRLMQSDGDVLPLSNPRKLYEYLFEVS